MAQTSAPVQLDQVLGTLKYDTRSNLQKLLQGYGAALAGRPTKKEDASQDRAVKGETAAKALNQSLRYSPDALRGFAIVNQALLGTDTHDLSKLITGGQKVAQALDTHEEQLKDLVTNFNLTTGALAAEQTGLRGTIRELPRVLEAANPTFDSLNQEGPIYNFGLSVTFTYVTPTAPATTTTTTTTATTTGAAKPGA
jgi:ABC-type transporter Mla subunit MlaD